jgi:hypothetical protein
LEDEKYLPLFIYCLLEQFGAIEQEYLQLIKSFDRLEHAAKEIRKNIARLFENNKYNYQLTETENKIILSIPLPKRIQLDISVYYNKYESIIPQIIPTIQMYENVFCASKIKVLVSELKYAKRKS